MINKIKITIVCSLLALILLSACSSRSTEEYVDYFYSQKLDDNSNQFTYILYLGNDGKSIEQHQKDHASISTEKSRPPKNSPKKSNDKEDEFTSLAFRMEEEAFRRLDRMLLEKEFCALEPSYDKSQYTWLRYTIKGKC
ncbi:MAG: hypothetical protein KUG78_07790 [Kangiellaceae bacterium]|nr:hypothetical protein [Kangiellaceae bacterium]